MSLQKVAIIGAGVAGLTAALSFARKGIACDIIEQADALTEVGAGLQLSPNATRIFGYLGILDSFENAWTLPRSIDLASGRSLRTLTRIETGHKALDQWHAPYAVLHRATLQQKLLDAVSANSLCQLHLGGRIEAGDTDSIERITGGTYQLLIGADGVWSQARTSIPAHGKPEFSGFVAWRFVIPEDIAPPFLPKDRVVGFLGRHTHLVSYPLKEIRGQNLVAITRGQNPGESWSIAPSKEAQAKFAETAFSGWHPGIKSLIATAANPTWWPLFGVTDGQWTNGKDTALVGDSAHAMLPFAAQGAVMAIEDSYRLAALAASLPLEQALSRFQAERKARVAKVKARGDLNRFAYHASGPIRLARNVVFAATPAQTLSAGLDWIYGYDAGA